MGHKPTSDAENSLGIRPLHFIQADLLQQPVIIWSGDLVWLEGI